MRAGPPTHPSFRWLVAARTTAILGNAIAPLALAFAVVDLTGSPTDLDLVMAARSIANVAVLLVGGVMADRLPRNIVLVGTSIGAAVTQGIVAAVVITGSATIPCSGLLLMKNRVNAAFTGAIAVLGPIVADATFGRASWGLVLASETVGFVLGGLIALHWRPRHALGIGVALTGMTAVPVMLLAVVPQVPVLIAASFLGGMAVKQFGIAWDQSLQQNIPADRLSRVYSYDAAGFFIAIPVGQICVGPLAGNFGTTPVLVGCAIIILISGLAAAAPSVRRLTSDPNTTPTPGTRTLVPSHSATPPPEHARRSPDAV